MSLGTRGLELELEQLRQQLQQAKEQTAQERERAAQDRERATQDRERATRAEEQMRRTSLKELLEACHELSRLMAVETNKSWSTQGSTTSPKDKCCPTTLKSWTDFPSIQQAAFAEFLDALHPPNHSSPQLFSPVLHIQELGRTLIQPNKIGSEAALRVYHSVAVEGFVRDIINILIDETPHGPRLGLGQGITFVSHTNTLSDLGEDVQASPPTSSKQPRPKNPTYADQICVFKNKGDQTELSYIIEYKAPHKLTKEKLRVGLRDMHLPTEVIQRASIPIDPHEKFCYHADRLVAAAITQTYLYMLESGVEYSCIVTGEAVVFLWIREQESNTLYYHLAEPNEEVHASNEDDFQYSLTAVSQLLSFCLMSIRSERRSQGWRDASIKSAQRWTVDWNQVLRGIPEDEETSNAPPSAYKARTYPAVNRSPYNTRSRPPRPSSSSCNPNNNSFPDHRNDAAGESDDGPETISTPSKRRVPLASTTRGGKRQRGTEGSSSAGRQHRQYCTQRCLLGLVQGFALDRSCPNASLHRRGKKGRNHLLNKQQLSYLVQRQLATDLDRNLKDLKKQGIRGALFQITLASHGYTFVAKATCKVFVPALQHEGRIYDRLQSIQGKMIPVYLGNIDLERPWRDLHVRLTHMLLMSWAGERADKVEGVRDMEMQIKRFENRIEQLGVTHNDLIPANILWNDRLQRMMFIDFEAATRNPSGVLQELSINRKRKHNVEKEAVDADLARRQGYALSVR